MAMALQQILAPCLSSSSSVAAATRGGGGGGASSTASYPPVAAGFASKKTNGKSWRRDMSVRAQGGGGGRPAGDTESKQVLDAFFLGKALAETVSERVGSFLGELLSEIGQRQAEQQKQIREFQDEVQERAKSAAVKAAQKALSRDTSSNIGTQRSSNDYEPTSSTTSESEGANGLPSLPYTDLPPLDSPAGRPTPSSEQGTPDY